MEYRWRKTERRTYQDIYSQYSHELVCFESYTEMDDSGNCLRAQVTAWGFKNSNIPIIRSELHNYDRWSYYIVWDVECDA